MKPRGKAVHFLDEAVGFFRNLHCPKPSIALILGSGLGEFAETLQADLVVRSMDIPHYPVSTVQGHAGTLVFGRIVRGKHISPPLLVFQGRIHYYESASLEPVVFPIQLAHKLGARKLIVTNAAGGINRTFRPGQLMLIKDIISLTFLETELQSLQSKKFIGPHRAGYFDLILQKVLRATALNNSIDLKEGTYCWLRGPSYETGAEIRMLGRLGVDAVGMSTVPEVVTARKLGMKTVGISLISNLATGIAHQKLSHREVTETANRVKDSFSSLMQDFVLSI